MRGRTGSFSEADGSRTRDAVLPGRDAAPSPGGPDAFQTHLDGRAPPSHGSRRGPSRGRPARRGPCTTHCRAAERPPGGAGAVGPRGASPRLPPVPGAQGSAPSGRTGLVQTAAAGAAPACRPRPIPSSGLEGAAPAPQSPGRAGGEGGRDDITAGPGGKDDIMPGRGERDDITPGAPRARTEAPALLEGPVRRHGGRSGSGSRRRGSARLGSARVWLRRGGSLG